MGAAGFGVFELVLAPQSTLAAVCVLLLAAGVCYTLWGTNALSVLQLEAPEHLRGRAAALYFFAFQGGAPIGGPLRRLARLRRGNEPRVRRRRRRVGHDGGLRRLLADPRRHPRDSEAADRRRRLLDLAVVDPAVSHEAHAPAVRREREHAQRGEAGESLRVERRSARCSSRAREGRGRPRGRAPAGGRRRAGRRARARRGPPRPGSRPCGSSRRRAASDGSRARSITAASPARTAPTGAQRPLLRLKATVSAGAASSASGHAERHRRVREPRAVEVDAGRGRRERGSLGRRQDRAARPGARVLEAAGAAPARRGGRARAPRAR